MTNEVRTVEMMERFGKVIKELVKDSVTFKGWKIILKPTATELIAFNKERLTQRKVKDPKSDEIHEKGLLECYVVLKQLNRRLEQKTTQPQTKVEKTVSK